LFWQDYSKPGEGIGFEEDHKLFEFGEWPVSEDDVVIAHYEKADLKDFFISAGKVDESMNHKEEVAV